MSANLKKVLLALSLVALAPLVPGCGFFSDFCGAAQADAIANIKRDGTVFYSASKQSQALLTGNGKSYLVTRGNDPLYTINDVPRLNLGSAYLSNDGHILVWMLAEHFLGTANTDTLKNPALIFFRDGKEVKRYSLEELLVRPKLISMSTSHTQWIPDIHDENWKFTPAVVFKADGSKMQLQTTSMRSYTFDPKSGAMLESSDTDVWQGADVIVYGELSGGSGQLHIKKAVFLKGKVDKIEEVSIFDPSGSYSSGYHTVPLKQVLGQWMTTAPEHKISTIYNMLY